MAISDTQKVDYLWKKLGYGATKTDTNANKLAPNEAISSPLLLRGDKVWQQAADIPTVQPGSSAGVVTVYPTSSPQECTADNTATANRSWKTGVTDWIPPEVGSTYQAKVYIATASDAGNASSGDQVFATGSGNNDEWFFDYQSGVLHFIGTNLPNGVSFTGKSVYVAGARYTGTFGVGSTGGTDANVGNLTIADTTITSTTSGDDITIDAEGGSFIISGTTGFVIPVGTTAQRDGSPTTGTLRYNSTTGVLEIYDGTAWDSVGDTSATVDSFDGDNSTTAFTMTADSTTDGTIVDINGVVQLPTTAYTVSGNVITFTQAPASGDKITTRLLVTMVGTTAQAAGSDQEIQFNSNDVLSASSNLTFNNSTNILTSPVIATNEIASPDSTILILNDDVQINGQVVGTLTADGVYLGDNEELQIGDGFDLRVFHDGTNNIYRNVANPTYIQTDDTIYLTKNNASETMATFAGDGAVSLYYDNSKKIETTSAGISVTGDISGTGGLNLTSTDEGSSAAPEVSLYRNSASPADADYLGQIKFEGENDADARQVYAKITGKILDASDGTEDGIIEIAHKKAGSNTITARFRSDSYQLLNGTSLTVNGLISTDSTMTATGNITGGNITTSGLTSTANLTVTGNGLFNSGVQEAFDTLTGSTGTVTHNCDNGHIFYHTGASGDITANFTNLSLTAEYGTNLTVIINQGATPYEVTAVQIGGVAQTINWQGGSQPTGNANGIDSFSFTILNDGGTYVVLGQMVDFT